MSTPAPSKNPLEQAHNGWFYATKSMAGTLFLRTFVPWQIWRFIAINAKMVGMIRMSHGGQRP